LEIDVSMPHSPDDSRQLIRHSDGRLVVATSRGDVDGPLLQSRQAVRRRSRRSLSREEDRPGPVREQAAQVDIAAFADAPEVPAASG
jgi:hypothetical protein